MWRGTVAAWECDAMGHLNVAFYVAKSMEALAGLAAELGLQRIFAPEAASTLIVREQYIRFVREAHANAPLSMTACVLSIGESDARVGMVMRHATGEIAAAFQTVVVHATAREGRAFPWPQRVLARAAALAGEIPEGGAPRSISLEPAQAQAGLARAEALGLRRMSLSAVLAHHCDAFGRLRTEGLMHRMSDGMPHLFAHSRKADPGAGRSHRGGAALEYRILVHAWPRAGDRVEQRSGIAGGDARFQRLFHWLLDPATGKAWASAQAISVALDLQARKIITLSDAELAEARKGWIDGLGF